MFIPPGAIIGIVGKQGSGKSLFALRLALDMAEHMRWDLCFNFKFDAQLLYRYLKYMGYSYLCSRLRLGCIKSRSCLDKRGNLILDEFLREKNCLYVFDEAGVFFNARRYREVSVGVLADLTQIRKDRRRMIWIAQDLFQVDKCLRMLTSSVIHTQSLTRFNSHLGNFELVFKNYFCFEMENYLIWLDKVLAKRSGFTNFFSTRKLSLKHWGGFLDKQDKMLFQIYGSFCRAGYSGIDNPIREKRRIQLVNGCENQLYRELPPTGFLQAPTQEIEESEPECEFQRIEKSLLVRRK